MINSVIKRDGTKSPFDMEKLKGSISSACKDAGMPDEKAASIADEISSSAMMSFEGEEVSTMDIKNKVLAKLDESYPEAASAWRKYDAEHGK